MFRNNHDFSNSPYLDHSKYQQTGKKADKIIETMVDGATSTLRSVLPHEPKPPEGSKGYLCLQGSFVPKSLLLGLGMKSGMKQPSSKGKKKKNQEEERSINKLSSSISLESFKERRCILRESIQSFLENRLGSDGNCHDTAFLSRFPLNVSLHENLLKCQLTFATHDEATIVTSFVRENSISVSDIMEGYVGKEEMRTWIGCDYDSSPFLFSKKQLQVTQLTMIQLPNSLSWPRVSPPKFRRLVYPPRPAFGGFGSYENIINDIDSRRRITRFVYISGFGDSHVQGFSSNKKYSIKDKMWNMLTSFDSSGDGIEFWTMRGKPHSYIGMRSNGDALKVIESLQGKRILISINGCEIIDAEMSECNLENESFISERIFVDWADITQRSDEKLRLSKNGAQHVEKREPSRSECTSITSDVKIPGLHIIPDYISPEIESILFATVTGPQAAWYKKQEKPSGGKVKRRVQHYGYVFDYETSDVLREKGLCPPLPCVPEGRKTELSEYMKSAVDRKAGWDLLAGVIESTRQYSFDICRFPNLNQLTINEYEAGQGIGSHIDTPSAFDDGLM